LAEFVFGGEDRSRTTCEWEHVLAQGDLIGPDTPSEQDGCESIEDHLYGTNVSNATILGQPIFEPRVDGKDF
jgi:hypothetical protein